MAKKIKTSRYWTRRCSNCNFEYPNWFTVCPKCKSDWKGEGGIIISETSAPASKSIVSQPPEPENEKTIKIIAQLTEEDVKISKLTLFFSADNGISWFQMDMKREGDYFAADILNVPINSTIVYYLKGTDENNMEFTEDNNQNFYYYHVSESVEPDTPQTSPPAAKPTEIPTPYKSSSSSIPYNVQNIPTQPTYKTNYDKDIPPVPQRSQPRSPMQSPNQESPKSGVIFTPLDQVQRDANLKICPNCKSKIKADWGICPICGNPQL